MSSFSRRRTDRLAAWVRAEPRQAVRFGLLAALPLAVLAGSPQRVALSGAIAAAYVVAAVATLEGRRISRAMLVYVLAAGAWLAVSWFRSRYLLHLQPDQLAYASSKAGYFVLIVLPMAAAVATMIEVPEEAMPAMATQLAVGAAVALVTVVTFGSHFLGTDRYSWQGNLIALGTVVAVQPWLIKRWQASALLGLLGVAGVIFAGSRQAVAALMVGLLFTAVYWAAGGAVRMGGPALARLRAAVTPYVLVPLVLVGISGAFIGFTFAGETGLFGGASSASCHCVTDRIVSLETSAGDRDKLLLRGVHLFLQSPLVGTGLGSFAGSVSDSLHPGTYYQYPHNVMLEAAAETGIVGFLLLFVPLLAGWAVLFWNGLRQRSGAVAALLAVTAVFFTVASVSGDIPSDRGLWIFGIVAFRLGLDRIRVAHAA